jgi:hypothetical protein
MEVLRSFEISETKHPTAQWDIPGQMNLLKNVGMSTRVHGVISQKTKAMSPPRELQILHIEVSELKKFGFQSFCFFMVYSTF